MKTYHDTQTGKFVSKERVKSDPAGTVEITSVDLRQEFIELLFYVKMNGESYRLKGTGEFVDEYIKQK